MFPKLLILILLFVFPSWVSASPDFSVTLDTTYIFSPDGTSVVKQIYSYTNLSSRTAASSYDIPVTGQMPTGLAAGDEAGSIKPQVSQLSSSSFSIHLPFNRIVAGKSKTKEFWFSYSGPSLTFSQSQGHVLLPQINQPPPDVTPEKIILRIPAALGSNAVFSTQPSTVSAPYAGYTDYVFNPADLQLSPLTGLIGNFKIFRFNLTYLLPPSGTLLLPSDSPAQKIFIDSVLPVPDRFFQNSQSIWQADYPAKSTASTQVNITGFALISLPQTAVIFPHPPQSKTIETYSGLFSQTSSLSLSWQKPWQIFPFFSTTGYLLIQNSGNSPVYSPQIKTNSTGLQVTVNPADIPSVILPKSRSRIPVGFRLSSLFGLSPHQLDFSLTGPVFQSITYNVPDYLFIIYYGCLICLLSLGIGLLAILTHRSRSIPFQKYFRKGNLRR